MHAQITCNSATCLMFPPVTAQWLCAVIPAYAEACAWYRQTYFSLGVQQEILFLARGM
jgi:hypothetical protein